VSEVLTTQKKAERVKFLNSLLPYNREGLPLDINGKVCAYEGDANMIRENTKLDIKAEHVEEIIKCKRDPIYFIENYAMILSLDNGYIYPKLRDYQIKLIKDLHAGRFHQIMMGRQSGKSITIMLFILWSIIFSSNPAIVGLAANTDEMSKENLLRLREMYTAVPIWLKRGIINDGRTFIMLDNGSRVYTSATTGNAFRGKSINLLFVDEVALIEKNVWIDFSSSVVPTISSSKTSKIIYATTAKGLNHWYEMWTKAENGNSLFKNTFVHWYEVPGRDESFKEEMIKTLPGGETEWYSEYECRFVGSQQTLISPDKIESFEHKQPLNANYMKDGLHKYFEAVPGRKYILSVDPYKNALDTFGIHVLDVTELPFKQVIAGGLKVNYLEMPQVIHSLALEYNNAFVIIENNEGAGQSIADTLYDEQRYGYKNMWFDTDSNGKPKKFPGFRTTSGNRNRMLSLLEMFISKDWIELNHKPTMDELKHFILINGKYQADKGYTDDLVMSLAIGLVLFSDTKNLSDLTEVLKHLSIDTEKQQQDIENRINKIVSMSKKAISPPSTKVSMFGVYSEDKHTQKLLKLRKQLGL